MMVLMMITGAVSRAKLQSPPTKTTNQHPTFYRPEALPIAQLTVSKHCRESVNAVNCDGIFAYLH